jgi:enediyne biosynthesis protein E4
MDWHNCRSSLIPSFVRRGGCASKKKSRSLLNGADGVVAQKTSGFERLMLLFVIAGGMAAMAGFSSAWQEIGTVTFSDAAKQAGINFKHENGASPHKYLPETMGSGALIFDYDNDGWPDIFLVNGGSFVDSAAASAARHRLYQNNRDGTFKDTTASSGILVSGFGMGACSADYDNDGWPDLYVTAVEANRLYRNNGNGTFTDVTAKAGVGGNGLWSSSCAFADIDNDGDVDLYVANYVDFTVKNNKYCSAMQNIRTYCHPNVYKPVPHVLYRNNGDGTFTDITKEAGVYRTDGNGLGVVFGDYDNDGWTDIYVANDSVPNFLFHNKGKGIFEEVGFRAGVSVGGEGRPLAGMGTDMADIDGDGLLDIIVTNLDRETHSLYRNFGKGLFSNVTFESGVGQATLPFVGFGVAFLDYDNDSDLDIAIANGDIIDNVSQFRDNTTHEQRNLLLQNDGTGRFHDVGPASGPGFALKKVSRTLVVGDLDNDGDLDILIGNNGQTADLLRNDGGNRNNSLLIRATGTKSNRDGIGARLKLTVGGKTLIRHIKAGSSYQGQNDLRVHFGLEKALQADRLEILWPSGLVDTVEAIKANQIITVTEGRGVTRQEAFRRIP